MTLCGMKLIFHNGLCRSVLCFLVNKDSVRQLCEEINDVCRLSACSIWW